MKAVTPFFLLASSTNSGLIPEPIVAIAFLIPNLSRFLTSFLPSTIMIASDSVTFGPAVIPWYSVSLSNVKTALTSSRIFFESSTPEFTIFSRSCFPLSITWSLLEDCWFSIIFTLITALHGPILSIVSRAAPITAVLTWSRDEDTRISPCTLPLF